MAYSWNPGADLVRERDALAVQVAHEWGWPADPAAVLESLRNRSTRFVRFCDEAQLEHVGSPEAVAAQRRDASGV